MNNVVSFPVSQQPKKKLGYVIASDKEEYLHFFKRTAVGIHKAWCVTPEFAIVYETHAKASKALKKLEVSYPVWVLELLENDKQLFVISSSEDKPGWME